MVVNYGSSGLKPLHVFFTLPTGTKPSFHISTRSETINSSSTRNPRSLSALSTTLLIYHLHYYPDTEKETE
ncbi:hypothetical protein PAMP_017911 [Pampus punctatissimus]